MGDRPFFGHLDAGLPRQATGPPRQTTGPPRSGAGVGVGMFRGAGDSLSWKYRSYQISISCFVIDMKFISEILKILFTGIFIISRCPSSQNLIKMRYPTCSKTCSHDILVFFEAFWYKNMNKYGFLRVRKSRNHGIWIFVFNEIGIWLYQSGAD